MLAGMLVKGEIWRIPGLSLFDENLDIWLNSF